MQSKRTIKNFSQVDFLLRETHPNVVRLLGVKDGYFPVGRFLASLSQI